MRIRKYIILLLSLPCLWLFFTGCKKMVEADPPKDQLTADKVFSDSSSTIAALLHIYTKFGLSSGTIEGYFAPYPSLYADELRPLNSSPDDVEYYTNGITINNSINAATWQSLYAVIYECNALINGIDNNGVLSATLKSQCIGEAKFLRAYCYFLLVNCYGDVPLVLSPDINETVNVPRTAVADVYAQIGQDLFEAENDLPEAYPAGIKVRANKWAASALLAKVYLYLEDWESAEAEATKVIGSGIYTPLEAPSAVFLANSKETILQFSENYGFTWSGNYFQPFFGSPTYALTTGLLSAFEIGDLRKQHWIDSVDNYGEMVYYPAKYKNSGFITANAGEYTMCLRVAEQYLVRAEARAHQDKISDAVSDINVIRSRAGTAPVADNVSADLCLQLCQNERRRELFTEWGNRFFDLKRTGTIDQVLSAVKPSWQSSAALYPIPQTEINYNSQLTQNPGY